MIPKIIHYCWFGGNEIPGINQECIDTWSRFNPEFKVCRWDENNAPMEHPYVQSAYKEKKYAFVSDYVRLWALSNYGGIYLDTDMYILKSLEDLLDDNCFFGYEDRQGVLVGTAIIGSEVSHPFINQILFEYDKLVFEKKKLSELIITRIITKALNRYNFKNIVIHDFDFFYPYPYNSGDLDRNFLAFKTENTFAIHLWNKSWYSKKDAYYLKYNQIANKVLKLFKTKRCQN